MTLTLSSKRRLLCCLFLTINVSCFAQFRVIGSYIEDTGQPIPFASVLLLNVADSTLEKGEITNAKGQFEIQVSKPGNYFLSVKYIGYENLQTKTFSLSDQSRNVDLGLLKSKESTQELSEVLIEGEKPLFEQKIDRTVVNVESNISASGGTALDVLSRSPGITVDKMNNSIALAGKSGVKIMINGKLSKIPIEAAVQMLDGMNAENIEKIELITTPPAKYEAEGDAGMINIVMKKEAGYGTNGNASIFGGYGLKEKYGGSININNRSEKVNLYGDYAYRNDVTQQLFGGDRQVNENGDMVSVNTANNRDATTRFHNGHIGLDWSVSDNTSVGGQFTIFDRLWEMDALADIYETTNNEFSSYTIMNTLETNAWQFMVGNFNVSHSFDKGQSLLLDIDYLDYSAKNPTDYYQSIYDGQRNLTGNETLSGRKNTPIKTWVGKLDYSTTLGDKVSLEAGGKGSFSQLKNTVTIEDDMVVDPSLSSKAEMFENIGAGYISSTIHASDKISLQLGVRYEYTRTNIDTEEQPDVVDRSFGGWFPSLFFQNNINKNNSWVLSYSRRVTRPSFFQIAPFVIFNDPNSLWSGNISLLPSYTDAIKAEYRYKSVLLSLQYSYDKNSISIFQPRINEDFKQVSQAENMDYRKNYSLNLSFPIQVTNWWECQFNATANWVELKADFYDNPLIFTIKNYTANGSMKFTLPRKFKFEISGLYQSPQLFGVAKAHQRSSISLGLEKKFNNSQLRFAYNDIFDKNGLKISTDIPEQNLHSTTILDFETRIFTITYSYSFGNGKVKVKRHKTGSEEEQQRFQ